MWIAGWLFSGILSLASVGPFLFQAGWSTVAGQGIGIRPGPFIQQVTEATQGLVTRAPWEWFGIHKGGWIWFVAMSLLFVALAGRGGYALIKDRQRNSTGVLLACAVAFGVVFFVAYQLAGFLFFSRFYIVVLIPSLALIAVGMTSGSLTWRVTTAILVFVTLVSHLGVTFEKSGRARDTSSHTARKIAVYAEGKSVVRVFCSDMFMLMPLTVLFPEFDIRMADTSDIPIAAQTLLGRERRIDEWPREWSDKKVLFVLSGWGGHPANLAEATVRVVHTLETLHAPGRTVHHLAYDWAVGGMKWTYLFEVE
jgi:hypothetical protein